MNRIVDRRPWGSRGEPSVVDERGCCGTVFDPAEKHDRRDLSSGLDSVAQPRDFRMVLTMRRMS